MAERRWSGLRQTYVIHFVDDREPLEVEVGLPDVLRWEKNNGKGYLDSGMPAITQMMWTAWAAGRRKGLIEEKVFDQFVMSIQDFEMEDQDDDDTTDVVEPTPLDLTDE